MEIHGLLLFILTGISKKGNLRDLSGQRAVKAGTHEGACSRSTLLQNGILCGKK